MYKKILILLIIFNTSPLSSANQDHRRAPRAHDAAADLRQIFLAGAFCYVFLACCDELESSQLQKNGFFQVCDSHDARLFLKIPTAIDLGRPINHFDSTAYFKSRTYKHAPTRPLLIKNHKYKKTFKDH